MSKEVFKLKSAWIFDLDNTLYSPKSKIFDQIDIRMKKFISKKLNISLEEAFKVQKLYYHKYGTTLYGLMQNHSLEPDEFLDFVHDINFKNLKKSKLLKKKLDSLPGMKLIYTNGDETYAKKILKTLDIYESFEEIFDIRKANFLPKPKLKPLKTLIDKYNLNPENIVYFEDLKKNLLTAHKIGITTILISDSAEKTNYEPFINFRFRTINGALDMIKKFI